MEPKRVVKIEVTGGVAIVAESPDDVEVEIIDLDVLEDRQETDPNNEDDKEVTNGI